MCMCMLNRRVQILFDKDSWNKLVKLAKVQNISAGEFIRRSVRLEMDKSKESESPRKGPLGLFKGKPKVLKTEEPTQDGDKEINKDKKWGWKNKH